MSHDATIHGVGLFIYQGFLYDSSTTEKIESDFCKSHLHHWVWNPIQTKFLKGVSVSNHISNCPSERHHTSHPADSSAVWFRTRKNKQYRWGHVYFVEAVTTWASWMHKSWLMKNGQIGSQKLICLRNWVKDRNKERGDRAGRETKRERGRWSIMNGKVRDYEG